MLATGKQVHSNPVYGSYFADPFVWKHGDIFYAIGTGELEANGHTLGKVFPLLQSSDFYQWQFASSALIRPERQLGDHFWAPAVACEGDYFYLYYSVGHGDKQHQLRVAVGESPQGPYKDAGQSLLDLTQCAFAIDPHPYRDEDGRWYLFFARDFLDCSEGNRAGTALVARPMKSMTELSGPETVILRATKDWQRFQAQRPMYGREWDWHTLEGPSVFKHEGRYYCFYSGGRWENETYGIDFCVADSVLGPYAEGGNGDAPRVLRTVPTKVIGPGHNSIITGPDGETTYIVYHAWDRGMKARRMFIDQLKWTAAGPVCDGPTWGPEAEVARAA